MIMIDNSTNIHLDWGPNNCDGPWAGRNPMIEY
jgi:hypothetical protein